MMVREGHVDMPDGVRLFFRRVGGAADPIVVLHGGPGFSMEYLAADLAPLADRHALLFYDQRGTGRSTLVSAAAALDAQRFVDDLESLRAHFGLDRMTLLGHSWGAGLAALYAIRHPQRLARLLLVGAIPLRRSELERTFANVDAGRDESTRREMQHARAEWIAAPGDAARCRAYYRLWFHPFWGDAAAATRSRGDFCAGPPEALRNKIESVDRFTLASLGDWDWRPALRAVTAPALVMHGTADVIAVQSAREWADAMPDGRLLLFEGIGHFPYVEAPAEFFAAVDEFMRGRWPPGARRVAR